MIFVEWLVILDDFWLVILDDVCSMASDFRWFVASDLAILDDFAIG